MSYTVNSLLIPIQLCGGKKTKHPRYNNVSRMFLSFSLAFDTIPHHCDYRIRKILRNLCLVNWYLQNAYGLLSWCFWKYPYAAKGIKAKLIKASLWWDKFQEKECFLTICWLGGVTLRNITLVNLSYMVIIIYDNFQNLGKRKRPDKLSNLGVFRIIILVLRWLLL